MRLGKVAVMVELLLIEFDLDLRNCDLVVDPANAHAYEIDMEQVDSGRVNDHGVLIPLT